MLLASRFGYDPALTNFSAICGTKFLETVVKQLETV
jgi:hypothetical protein